MRVFIAHSWQDRELVLALADTLRKHGDEVLDPFAQVEGGEFLSQVSTMIHSADVIVAILSRRSPSVYYELGLASGAGKSSLVVAPPGEQLPADVSALPYTQTSGDTSLDAQAIARRLAEFRIIEQQPTRKFDSARAALQATSMDYSYLESLNPAQFEKLLADLFRENGYTVHLAQETRDVGYDFAIESPKHGGRILVEAKKMNRQSRVPVEAVRQLLSVIHSVGAVSGVLISTSGFTSAATALGAASSIVLRTLNDLLTAKNKKEFFGVTRKKE